ncbi:9976_t:CDS:1, partial [Ambispora gerdemannii]
MTSFKQLFMVVLVLAIFASSDAAPYPVNNAIQAGNSCQAYQFAIGGTAIVKNVQGGTGIYNTGINTGNGNGGDVKIYNYGGDASNEFCCCLVNGNW